MEVATPVKRFYRTVSVEPVGADWQVHLDGRPLRTVGGQAQAVPSRALAEALAVEWAGQASEIEIGHFVLRDLADYALDVVAPDRAAATGALLRFAETDTLCYRAPADEPLASRQLEVWEPLLRAAEARWDVHFVRIEGVIHQPQAAETLARMCSVLESHDSFALAALATLASLAASLVIALAALAPEADVAALWAAASLEEEWQADLWGREAEAEAHRARRAASFAAAVSFARLARV